MGHSTQSINFVTQGSLSVSAVDALANDLVTLWCEPRQAWLNKRESRIPYVVDLFKKVRNGIARPFHMLLAGSFADVDDGAPINVVVQPYEAAIALIRERHASKMRQTGLPFAVRFRAMNQRETRVESKMTAMQFAVDPEELNLDQLLALRAASREYQHVKDEYDAMLDERIAQAQLERATA